MKSVAQFFCIFIFIYIYDLYNSFVVWLWLFLLLYIDWTEYRMSMGYRWSLIALHSGCRIDVQHKSPVKILQKLFASLLTMNELRYRMLETKTGWTRIAKQTGKDKSQWIFCCCCVLWFMIDRDFVISWRYKMIVKQEPNFLSIIIYIYMFYFGRITVDTLR